MKPPITSDARNARKRTGTRMLILTVAGGIVFWLASFFTSLLPLAASYRAAYSDWSRETVWIGAAFMGLIIGGCVSFLYLRLFEKIPAKQPVLKAILVSTAVLFVVTLAVNLPMMLRTEQMGLLYFLVGVLFDTVRFLLAGLAIGLVDQRLRQRAALRADA